MASDRERTPVLHIHLYKCAHMYIPHMCTLDRGCQETFRTSITGRMKFTFCKVHRAPKGAASGVRALLSALQVSIFSLLPVSCPLDQMFLLPCSHLPKRPRLWRVGFPAPQTALAPHPARCQDKHQGRQTSTETAKACCVAAQIDRYRVFLRSC